MNKHVTILLNFAKIEQQVIKHFISGGSEALSSLTNLKNQIFFSYNLFDQCHGHFLFNLSLYEIVDN